MDTPIEYFLEMSGPVGEHSANIKQIVPLFEESGILVKLEKDSARLVRFSIPKKDSELPETLRNKLRHLAKASHLYRFQYWCIRWRANSRSWSEMLLEDFLD